ncbi:MAG: helix-turn-helix domain-containing protein [Eubacterium sp.]
MKMTKKIYHYMTIHQIDIEKVSKETGIDRKIFETQPMRPLNATELCELCAYLKIQPEEIAKDDTLF